MVRRSRRWLVLVPLFFVCALAAPASAQETTASTGWRSRPVRTGTVSLGGQLQYGALVGGEFSDDFNHGLGVGFNLRYRTASDAAIAVSFEAHNFDVKVPSDSAAGFNRLQFITTTLDYVKYGATRSRMPKYFTIGAGLAHDVARAGRAVLW